MWQVLKDDTTLAENEVTDGFMVVMVTKVHASPLALVLPWGWTHLHVTPATQLTVHLRGTYVRFCPSL